MLYDDAFLARLETGLRAALPTWNIGETAELSLLTISENAPSWSTTRPAAAGWCCAPTARPTTATRRLSPN